METRVYYKATPEDIAEAFLMKDREIEALRAENERLQQVSALTCDKCGWAMQFPGEECRNCGYEALRAENARLREALKPFAEAADIYNLNDFLPSIDEEYTSFQIALCRAARAAMGESDE